MDKKEEEKKKKLKKDKEDIQDKQILHNIPEEYQGGNAKILLENSNVRK